MQEDKELVVRCTCAAAEKYFPFTRYNSPKIKKRYKGKKKKRCRSKNKTKLITRRDGYG